MLNQPVIATMLILALVSVGEIVSIISRARIPMLLVVLVGYLTFVWTGIFPSNIVEKSTFAAVGAVLTAPLIVHMGTLIPLKVMKKQIKAVIIALSGVIVSSLLILLFVTLFFDYKTAVSGVGPLTGGIIAFIVTTTELKRLGLVALITVPVLVMAFQGLIGMPLAANLLRKHALKLRNAMDAGTYVAATAEAVSDQPSISNSKSVAKAKKYNFNSNIILLFKLFFGGALAIMLDKWTGINYSLWCLALGLIGTKVKFYQDNMMERANSFTVGMLGIIFIVISSMNGITFKMFVGYLPQVITILGIGTIGIIIGGFTASKLLKWDPFKGIPVALTALFGFPGDYLLCEEVSRSVARNEKEQKQIFDEILTPMLIGGFTTVTIASVIIAGILVKTL
ncbi:hypothetical protein [Bacillus sp. FJAT-49736]|uniref:hypothetical protein n=1 Tax=Bacillus sp. FJAT-49736 TaxID=2833582 RepID=UPI001BCA1BA9|nr:hypothetical protein [Bacillus sp. FJAT-49736]MBS4172765.1 hypothetical protein [Bacillus sp. FJAT-49736]